MESSARRAFLMGRRAPPSPWDAFCTRMRRRIEGEFLDFGFYDGFGSARLTPKCGADVRHAQALCGEYGIMLVLGGVEQAQAITGQSVLWIEPGGALSRCEPVADQPGKWFVQPGCLLRDLVAAGLTQFLGTPGYLTVGSWLADRTLCDWAPGQTAASGLLHAAVLLDDGTTATLGPFGTEGRQALATARLQKLIPALFELARMPLASLCREQARWPARYRLDALLPAAGYDVNLAHLLLGHGGDLAWVEWLVFEAVEPAAPSKTWVPPFSAGKPSDPNDARRRAPDLDAQVKLVFDPSGRFPHFNQSL